MNKYSRPESSATLARRYEDQARIQRAVIRELTSLRDTLGKLESAFRTLLADEHFINLLRAEGLQAAPAILVRRTTCVQTEKCGFRGQESVSLAGELLDSKTLSPTARYELARMAPARQEEAARLMIASGCFISPYIRTIVGACEKSELAKPKARPRRVILKQPLRDAANKEIFEMARQIKELDSLSSTDLIAAFVCVRYAGRLLRNMRVRVYLNKRQPELESVVESFAAFDAAVN